MNDAMQSISPSSARPPAAPSPLSRVLGGGASTRVVGGVVGASSSAAPPLHLDETRPAALAPPLAPPLRPASPARPGFARTTPIVAATVPHVKYVAQLDFESMAERRGVLGVKVRFFLTLDGILLSLFRDRSAREAAKHVVNVRMHAVSVRVDARELSIAIPGKDKPMRLVVADRATAEKWRDALHAAMSSDIEEFYQLGKTIGGGAFGTVVLAWDRKSKEKCAVKIIQRTSGTSAKMREHLQREMEVMKCVNHPGVVRTYHIFNLHRTIYIAMELVEGGDLFDFISEQASLKEGQAISVVKGILEAVNYLHGENIVHRDLKPENILCVRREWPLEIKLTDFGFASFFKEGEDEMAPGDTMRTPVGTAYFMAPEIIANRGRYNNKVDLFAVGVVTYTLLTGRLPFPGLTTREYWNHVVKGNARFPDSLWHGISIHAKNLVKGLLNVDPEKRLTAFAALQHDWIVGVRPKDSVIRRDRSNLHSKKRRLQKVRAALIAITMMHKVERIHESHYGLAKLPEAIDKTKEFGDKTKVKTKEFGERTKVGAQEIGGKTVQGLKTGAKKTGEEAKKAGDGIKKTTVRTTEVIGSGVKKTGETVKKTGETVKVGIGKTADGAKRTTDAIGSGVKSGVDKTVATGKKTGEFIGENARKTGQGVKKAADGIRRNHSSDNNSNGTQRESERSRRHSRRPFHRNESVGSSHLPRLESSEQNQVPVTRTAGSASGSSSKLSKSAVDQNSTRNASSELVPAGDRKRSSELDKPADRGSVQTSSSEKYYSAGDEMDGESSTLSNNLDSPKKLSEVTSEKPRRSSGGKPILAVLALSSLPVGMSSDSGRPRSSEGSTGPGVGGDPFMLGSVADPSRSDALRQAALLLLAGSAAKTLADAQQQSDQTDKG